MNISPTYTPPKAPQHTVETRYVRTHPDRIQTEGRLFVDGVDVSDTDIDSRYGWANIAKWRSQTKAFAEREAFVAGGEAYDTRMAAYSRRVKAFGDIAGVPTTEMTLGFEVYLMSTGWTPIMLDALNAYSPGLLAAKDGRIYRTHLYAKAGKILSMQFGYGNTNFAFILWDTGKAFQIPSNSTLFDDAVAGLLPELPVPERMNVSEQ
jgi:hypothetical protein